MKAMSEAPERIWMDPDIGFPECEKQYGCDIGYVRLDLYEELEAKLAKPRSLCQGKYLACRIEGLEAKLARSERRNEALEELRPIWAQGSSNALAQLWEMLGASNQTQAVEALAELKGDKE
jgi:hypothetical protein